MVLFAGYNKVHGVYKLTGDVEPSGKRKGKAATLKEPVTVDMWTDHLTGNQGLGVVPINELSLVKFGAIDVDVYPIQFEELYAKIETLSLPLILCSTKSEGAHLYMFLKEWVPASLVQERLRAFAAILGFGDSEIFPRQTTIIESRGDVGQWINMPYFGGSRMAMGKDGFLEIEEFVKVAYSKQLNQKELESFQLPIQEILPSGPPCLQILIKSGFPPGTRNNGLFNLGIYARKSNPDSWRNLVEEYNNTFMDPPLSMTEVLGVIKSLDKKDFTYLCKQQPIIQYCNQERCRTCEHGIGKHDIGMPRFGTLTKLTTEPPIWFLEVEGGGRLELTTEDLQSPRSFQKVCISALNIMPSLPKAAEWEDIIRRLLQTVTIIEVPKEATPKGQLIQHLEDFCTSRVQGKCHDDLLLGKPWLYDRRHFFRMKDFLSYLDRQKFRMDMNMIAAYIKDLNAQKHFFNIKGKGLNCYSVPEFAMQNESLEAPVQPNPPFA